MTSATVVERSITAFLDGEDSLEINNIIHSTEGAARFGYTGPLVGGVTVYAWTARAVVEALGEAWLDEGWIEFQLRRPVYPGDEMTTRVEVASGAATFEMTKGTGEVAVRGTAGLGVADFASEITRSQERTPAPTPAQRPFIRRELYPGESDLAAMAIPFSAAESAEYADTFARDPHPRWRSDEGYVHPAWIAHRANQILAHSWRYTSIHVSSQIQHLAPARPGQEFLVSGRFADTYQRKGHEYTVLDVTLTSEDGRDLALIRQPTIYQVAPRV